jgi:hypothetical protein
MQKYICVKSTRNFGGLLVPSHTACSLLFIRLFYSKARWRKLVYPTVSRGLKLYFEADRRTQAAFGSLLYILLHTTSIFSKTNWGGAFGHPRQNKVDNLYTATKYSIDDERRLRNEYLKSIAHYTAYKYRLQSLKSADNQTDVQYTNKCN